MQSAINKLKKKKTNKTGTGFTRKSHTFSFQLVHVSNSILDDTLLLVYDFYIMYNKM